MNSGTTRTLKGQTYYRARYSVGFTQHELGSGRLKIYVQPNAGKGHLTTISLVAIDSIHRQTISIKLTKRQAQRLIATLVKEVG